MLICQWAPVRLRRRLTAQDEAGASAHLTTAGARQACSVATPGLYTEQSDGDSLSSSSRDDDTEYQVQDNVRPGNSVKHTNTIASLALLRIQQIVAYLECGDQIC